MNRAQMADTGNERLQLFLRMRRLKQIVDDVEADQAAARSKGAAYLQALRDVEHVRSALKRSAPVKSSPRIIKQGDPGFAEAEARWKAQRGYRHKMFTP